MELSQITNIHLVGIGGIGVSAIANIFLQQGKHISGSDQSSSEITTQLQQKGAKIFYQHAAENLSPQTDILVYSPAIPPDNPERQRAQELRISQYSYPQILGELSKHYFTIAIAGTHGKSTTTAMTSLIFEQAGLDPTVIIGTKIPQFNNQNYRLGQSKYLILEACEYKGSFLNLHPDILAITNIEPDHLDHFKTAENYFNTFKKAEQKAKQIIKDLAPKTYNLQVIGDFNKQNATTAAAIAHSQEISQDIIQKALHSFTGTWRRQEYKLTKGKTKFFDDYAHHPTEIQAALQAFRQKHPQAKILTIFQPHQYNRTHELLKQFTTAFAHTDQLIIPNIYEVRDTEQDKKLINTDQLVRAIQSHHPNVQNGQGLQNTARYISQNYQNFDLIITMGAGDIYKIYQMIH